MRYSDDEIYRKAKATHHLNETYDKQQDLYNYYCFCKNIKIVLSYALRNSLDKLRFYI